MVKILVVGAKKAGKTSLGHRFAGKEFPPKNVIVSNLPDFQSREFVTESGQVVSLYIWDSPGDDLSSVPRGMTRSMDVCVLAYDCTSLKSLQHLKSCHERFSGHSDKDPAFVVIGCKSDLNRTEISEDDARAVCKSMEVDHYFETSSKLEISIEDTLTAIVQIALEKQDLAHDPIPVPV
jgi:small GTP-binding protein